MQMESQMKFDKTSMELWLETKRYTHSEGVNVFSNHIGLLENWNTSDEQYGAIFFNVCLYVFVCLNFKTSRYSVI